MVEAMRNSDLHPLIKADPELRNEYPFASHYCTTGGFQQHYIDEGVGEPVVMLHGNPTWSFYFRNLARALRSACRVIVPDHMGCGFSDKPHVYSYHLKQHIDNLEALIDTIKPGPFTMVVHDWGGAIGFGYAVRHPEMIKQLIVLNSAAFMSDHIPLPIYLCRIPLFAQTAVLGFNAFVRTSLIIAVNKRSRMTPAVRRGYLLPYNSWKNRIATLRFVQDIPRSPREETFEVLTDMEEKLPLLKQHRMLILWGALDWCFNKDFLHRWQGFFPDARTVVFPDASHYILEDAHEKVIPHVLEFLK